MEHPQWLLLTNSQLIRFGNFAFHHQTPDETNGGFRALAKGNRWRGVSITKPREVLVLKRCAHDTFLIGRVAAAAQPDENICTCSSCFNSSRSILLVVAFLFFVGPLLPSEDFICVNLRR